MANKKLKEPLYDYQAHELVEESNEHISRLENAGWGVEAEALRKAAEMLSRLIEERTRARRLLLESATPFDAATMLLQGDECFHALEVPQAPANKGDDK